MTKPKEITSTQQVLDAARDLAAQEQDVTREALHAATGLALYIVDERIRVLINDGKMLRLERGKYAPAETFHETRAMSRTILPGGVVKYEIGDHILELSPQEDRNLADLSAGALVKLIGIEGNRLATALHSRLGKVEKIQRDRERRADTKASG